MNSRTIPRPDRLRRIPPGFGWIDHRFIRQGHSTGLSCEAMSLYLFLATVANSDGLSWYSAEKLCGMSGLTCAKLEHARRELEARSLIAYACPVYQVLALPENAVFVSTDIPGSTATAKTADTANIGDTATAKTADTANIGDTATAKTADTANIGNESHAGGVPASFASACCDPARIGHQATIQELLRCLMGEARP